MSPVFSPATVCAVGIDSLNEVSRQREIADVKIEMEKGCTRERARKRKSKKNNSQVPAQSHPEV